MNTSVPVISVISYKFISDEISYLVSSLILRTCVQIILRFFGSFANLINIIIFIKLGLSDSIGVSFFSLAVADFTYLSVFMISIFVSIPERYCGVRPYVNLSMLSLLVMYYALMVLDISIVLNLYISLMKTCCVVLPFIFRNMFTKSRTVFTVVSIYSGVFLYYLTLLVEMILDFKEVFSPLTNETRMVLIFSPSILDMFEVYTTVSKIVLPFSAQIFMIVCLFLMSKYLKKASQFRQNVAQLSKEQIKSHGKYKKDSKEIRVIQAVVVLSIIFIICNLPLVLIYIANLSFTEFSNFGPYRNLFRLCGDISDTLFILNSSANIFVYLKFNFKYRQTFMALFKIN